jgi:hypothetical protein
MNRSLNVKRLWPLSLTLLLAASFSACDVLEDDNAIGNGTGVVVDNAAVQVLPQGTAIIDLNARVRTERPIRLDITSGPRYGKLRELRAGLLQYQPNADFKEGRDSFRFAIYADNDRLLLEDTVGIIVDDDTTHLPCGVYTRTDSISLNGADGAYIYPLENDILCGDTAHYRVEVFQPQPAPASPPYYGTATANAQFDYILYTATSNPHKDDLIIYKVYDITDTTRVGYGVIFINADSTGGEGPEEPEEPGEQPCQFTLVDDFYRIALDTLQTDTLYFMPFQNDSLCDRSWQSYTLGIEEQSIHGLSITQSPWVIKYGRPQAPFPGLMDSLVYRACYGDTCRTAKIRIYFQ